MKIVEVENGGLLQVFQKDVYQHPIIQGIAHVKPGEMVVVMGSVEFQRFKRTL